MEIAMQTFQRARSSVATVRLGAVVVGLGTVVVGIALTSPAGAGPDASPGVTATEIKIGQVQPYSGPASAYSVIGKVEGAYFKMLNDKGGISGHKLTLMSNDDSYVPAKAVEQTRKLVEGEGVAFIFNSVGTPGNSAVLSYLNQKGVPQLFVATGADKFADPQKNPWTIGFAPSYRTEAKVYGKYLAKTKPAAKVCVLYQNDDFGKDYVTGLKEAFGASYDKTVIKTASYEATDPSVDSQIITLQGAGCDTLIAATTSKFGAGAIRKVSDLGWKPLFFMSNVSVSLAAVLKPVGVEKAKDLITGLYLKDPSNPAYASDAGLNEYKEFMKKFAPDLDASDANVLYGYTVAVTLAKVLSQCGTDFSRKNIMKQAANLKDFVVGTSLPGVKINTSPTDFRPYQTMQLGKFNGTNFEPFGEVITE
jgi:branched-chain amino acid transport system substrate-binding protein